MLPVERIEARMEGRPADRMPNLSLVMQYAARLIGVPYGRYLTDCRVLTEGVWRCRERYGIDMPSVISGNREAAGFGAKITVPEDAPAYLTEPLVKEIGDVAALRCADIGSVGPMADRIEAVRLLSRRLGGEAPVLGWVEGAVSQVCDLMNISDAMVNFLDEPEAMGDFLDLCADYAADFAREQIRAGAAWIGVGDAAASLMGPRLYRAFALPREQRLIAAVHDAGGRARLHICGNINPILADVWRSGADIIDCDHMVDMEEAARLWPETTVICGNFDPVRVLLQGTPELVRGEVRRCMELGKRRRNMVAPGCEVPKFTPEENMLAFSEELGRP